MYCGHWHYNISHSVKSNIVLMRIGNSCLGTISNVVNLEYVLRMHYNTWYNFITNMKTADFNERSRFPFNEIRCYIPKKSFKEIVSDERCFLIRLQKLIKKIKNPEKLGTLLGCGDFSLDNVWSCCSQQSWRGFAVDVIVPFLRVVAEELCYTAAVLLTEPSPLDSISTVHYCPHVSGLQALSLSQQWLTAAIHHATCNRYDTSQTTLNYNILK